MSARTIDDIRPHTTLCENNDGTFTAVFTHGAESAIATGEDEDQALLYVLAKLRGDDTPAERPWLALCTPCNRRAAAAGDKSEAEGRIRDETCEVCALCAIAIDKWEDDFAKYLEEQKRKARNKRKAKLRLIK